MIYKELSVSVGRTVNLGNFESLRVDVSATATVDGDDITELRETMTAWLKAQCRKLVTECGTNE